MPTTCRLIILANVSGTHSDPPHVVQRSALGSCDCRYAGAAHPAPGAPRLYTRKGAKRSNPSWLKGDRNAPSSPLPNPICVQNVKMTPNEK